MPVTAHIYMDGSSTPPYQHGLEHSPELGVKRCGVCIQIFSDNAENPSPSQEVHEFADCWVTSVTSGLCELAALCFSLIHLRQIHQAVIGSDHYSRRHSGGGAWGYSQASLDVIHFYTDSSVVVNCMRCD
jgi:ribonuclease HI